MKNSFVIISALVLFSMLSCVPKQNELKEPQPLEQSQTQLKQWIADSLEPGTNVTPSEKQSEQTGTAVVLNPPHGQPGHLCEIPVGSPLPASKAKTTPEAKKIETTPPAKTAQRLNPPHGEPGHRCEIAVGAPLDTPAPGPAAGTGNGSFSPSVENAARLKAGQR